MFTFATFTAALLLLAASPADAATKLENCLKSAKAKDTATYCAGKYGTKAQKACVKDAKDADAKQACLAAKAEAKPAPAPAAPAPAEKK